jgi:hypothetical protein
VCILILVFWSLACPLCCVFGVEDIWSRGYLEARISGVKDVWRRGYLNSSMYYVELWHRIFTRRAVKLASSEVVVENSIPKRACGFSILSLCLEGEVPDPEGRKEWNDSPGPESKGTVNSAKESGRAHRLYEAPLLLLLLLLLFPIDSRKEIPNIGLWVRSLLGESHGPIETSFSKPAKSL